MPNHTLRFFVFLLVFVTTSHAIASVEPKPQRLESAGIKAMGEGEYEQAETVFRELIEIRPDSFVGHYNLGAALSMQGDGDGAVEALSAAITLGFTDLAQLKRDPDLDAFRSMPFFDELVANWQALVEARRQNDIDRLMPLIRKGLEARTDEELKIELLSAHDQIATDQASEELQLLASWANDELFSEVGSLEDLPWVVVALPDRTGFMSWAVTVFGPGVQGNISSVGWCV